MSLHGTRPDAHADSWYTSDPEDLSAELDKYLENVPAVLDGHGLPIVGARVVIAPHAGYRYSGPCAAWAYKALDLSRAKRVFVLGPSHTFYLHGCALTTFQTFATPFGNFTVDADVITQLRGSGKFKDIPRKNDIREHSLEMHLPYIWKMLEQAGRDASTSDWPMLVPIMVGDGDRATERDYGELLLPYMTDPENVFVVSSDFCHWGRDFDFCAYCPGTDLANIRSLLSSPSSSSSRSAGGAGPRSGEPPIHEFIRVLDEAAFRAIESGSQDAFVNYLHQTDNTVCGRHPISVTMAALELLTTNAISVAQGNIGAADAKKGQNRFSFVRYERSKLAQTTLDSSVSYGAAYAII